MLLKMVFMKLIVLVVAVPIAIFYFPSLLLAEWIYDEDSAKVPGQNRLDD